MLGDETLYIGQTAAGKMRPGDAKMVQELGQARLDRRVLDGTDGGSYGRSPYSGIGTTWPARWSLGSHPRARISCSLCMISTIAPESLSLSRL